MGPIIQHKKKSKDFHETTDDIGYLQLPFIQIPGTGKIDDGQGTDQRNNIRIDIRKALSTVGSKKLDNIIEESRFRNIYRSNHNSS